MYMYMHILTLPFDNKITPDNDHYFVCWRTCSLLSFNLNFGNSFCMIFKNSNTSNILLCLNLVHVHHKSLVTLIVMDQSTLGSKCICYTSFNPFSPKFLWHKQPLEPIVWPLKPETHILTHQEACVQSLILQTVLLPLRYHFRTK